MPRHSGSDGFQERPQQHDDLLQGQFTGFQPSKGPPDHKAIPDLYDQLGKLVEFMYVHDPNVHGSGEATRGEYGWGVGKLVVCYRPHMW